MGAVVMVLGRSGSGKSTSLRNFRPGEVGVFNVLGKPLPFPGGAGFPTIDRPDYRTIERALKQNALRAYAIDDSTYLMQNENFARAAESGYTKFTEMAQHFQQLLLAALATDGDTIVYLLHHADVAEDGTEKVKTIGRMLDEKYCIEGACTMVLDCRVIEGEHVFVTKNDGRNLAKAPMGMLPDVMENDLREVDSLAREYWGMKPIRDEPEEEEGEGEEDDA